MISGSVLGRGAWGLRFRAEGPRLKVAELLFKVKVLGLPLKRSLIKATRENIKYFRAL